MSAGKLVVLLFLVDDEFTQSNRVHLTVGLSQNGCIHRVQHAINIRSRNSETAAWRTRRRSRDTVAGKSSWAPMVKSHSIGDRWPQQMVKIRPDRALLVVTKINLQVTRFILPNFSETERDPKKHVKQIQKSSNKSSKHQKKTAKPCQTSPKHHQSITKNTWSKKSRINQGLPKRISKESATAVRNRHPSTLRRPPGWPKIVWGCESRCVHLLATCFCREKWGKNLVKSFS